MPKLGNYKLSAWNLTARGLDYWFAHFRVEHYISVCVWVVSAGLHNVIIKAQVKRVNNITQRASDRFTNTFTYECTYCVRQAVHNTNKNKQNTNIPL